MQAWLFMGEGSLIPLLIRYVADRQVFGPIEELAGSSFFLDLS